MAKLSLRLNRREPVVRPQAKISPLLTIFAIAEVFLIAFAWQHYVIRIPTTVVCKLADGPISQ
jgi:hypothetical protein